MVTGSMGTVAGISSRGRRDRTIFANVESLTCHVRESAAALNSALKETTSAISHRARLQHSTARMLITPQCVAASMQHAAKFSTTE